MASALWGVACNDDSPDRTSSDFGEDVPVYAVAATSFSADFSNQTSYVWLVNDLEAGSVGLGDAFELPGGATVWGVHETGAFYVLSAENVTFSKYVVERGVPKRVGEPLGLAGEGVTQLLTPQVVFDGPDHAFLLDVVSAQAIELDLKTMSIAGSIDLSSALFDASLATQIGEHVVKRGREFVTTLYATSFTYDSLAETSKVLFFDPVEETVQVTEAPCGGINDLVRTSNGDVYIAPDPYAASLHLVAPDDSAAPCMVRLPAGAHEVDEEVVMLNELTGAPSGGLITGSDDTAFFRVLDMASYTPTEGATYAEPYSTPAWQTWRMRLGEPSTAEPTERDPVAAGVKTFEVNGETYENESAADFASATLVRTTGAGAPAHGLSMPGVIWGVVRVR